MKKLKLIPVFVLMLISIIARGKEGMWLPVLVEQLNYTDLQACGFKLSSEEIYSVNKACLKDAVVLFGSGCTGAVISDKGLLLTNHHCGVWNITKNSTVEKNYLENGFWAMNNSEELINPGLTVKFLVEMREVTSLISSDISANLNYNDQQEAIDEKIRNVEMAIEDTTDLKASIESFWAGNNYYLFLYSEYRDIRLVGAPPESVANFGGDVDNWVWPRHSADFAVFRIYASPDGKPADYSEKNIPLRVKKSLSISAKGIKDGDFTMVLGYPGSTFENVYSGELEYNYSTIYPNRIKLRDGRLDIINKARTSDKKIYLQYASKQSQISNSWKKWKGVQYGFEKFDVIQKRKNYEQWLLENAGSQRNELQELYDSLDLSFNNYKYYNKTVDYLSESVFIIDPFSLSRRLIPIISEVKKGGYNATEEKLKLIALKNTYFSLYYQDIDKALTSFLLKNYRADIDEMYVPEALKNLSEQQFKVYIDKIYAKSVLTDSVRFNNAIIKVLKGKTAVFYKDPLFGLYLAFRDIYNQELATEYLYYKNQYQSLYKEYYTIIREIDTTRVFYPDANLTMRVTYGQVKGYSPSDAIEYTSETYSEGLIQKLSSGITGYSAPKGLIDLFTSHTFGSYSDNSGRLPLCFVASNHTSGGNSGSPVVDSAGMMIGLNFDRTWESTMSDFYFDDKICRNIAIDVRYILFIIDKYAGAGYLLDEMDIRR